jgi:hypothetical protein
MLRETRRWIGIVNGLCVLSVAFTSSMKQKLGGQGWLSSVHSSCDAAMARYQHLGKSHLDTRLSSDNFCCQSSPFFCWYLPLSKAAMRQRLKSRSSWNERRCVSKLFPHEVAIHFRSDSSCMLLPWSRCIAASVLATGTLLKIPGRSELGMLDSVGTDTAIAGLAIEKLCITSSPASVSRLCCTSEPMRCSYRHVMHDKIALMRRCPVNPRHCDAFVDRSSRTVLR